MATFKCTDCREPLPVEDIPVDVICPACGLNQYVNERGGQGAYWDRSRAKFKGFD
jgi:Zn finger protein HypA/HybF involved in hydrogenase expression